MPPSGPAASNNSCCGARPARRLRETLLTVRPLPLAPLPASATGGGRVAPHRTVAIDCSNLTLLHTNNKTHPDGWVLLLAEAVRFELTVGLTPSLVFKTSSINHSDKPPYVLNYSILQGKSQAEIRPNPSSPAAFQLMRVRLSTKGGCASGSI